MIAFVSGPVAALAPDSAVVEVGGIGIAVQCTPNTLSGLRMGQQAKLATSLVVREDSLTLYGFADDDERQTFELLQTASGVGPRLAQAMLAVHSPDALRRAVSTGDEKALIAVPGIGKKGAQKLLLELKDRLGEPSARGGPAIGTRRHRRLARAVARRAHRPRVRDPRGRRGGLRRRAPGRGGRTGSSAEPLQSQQRAASAAEPQQSAVSRRGPHPMSPERPAPTPTHTARHTQ